MGKTNKLKGLRAEHKYTQAEMGKKLGITGQAYHQKENELLEFKENEINKIIKLFDEPYENIFFDRKYTV